MRFKVTISAFALFLLCIVSTLEAQHTTNPPQTSWGASIAEIYLDQQNGLVFDYPIHFTRSGDVRMDWSTTLDMLKVYAGNIDDFLSFATKIQNEQIDYPIQVFFCSSILGNFEDNETFCMLGYCFIDGKFHTANELSTLFLLNAGVDAKIETHNLISDCQFVKQSHLHSFPKEPEIHLLGPTEGRSSAKLTPLIINIRRTSQCFQLWQAGNGATNEIQKELCSYVHFTNKQISPEKPCMKFRRVSPGTDIHQCKEDWLTCIKKCIDLPDGTVFGHVPDTCAGGNPFPEGCWLPQNSLCNSSIAGQCSRQRMDNCVEYNEVVIHMDGVQLFCESVLLDQEIDGTTCRERIEEEMEERKEDWGEWVRSVDPGCVPVCLSRWLDKQDKTFPEYLCEHPEPTPVPSQNGIDGTGGLGAPFEIEELGIKETVEVSGIAAATTLDEAKVLAIEDATAELNVMRASIAAKNSVPLEAVKFCLDVNRMTQSYPVGFNMVQAIWSMEAVVKIEEVDP